MVYSETLRLKIKSKDFYDITVQIESAVSESEIRNGVCNVFVLSSTSGVLINENEPMLIQDLKNSLNKIAPENDIYQHVENAYSHIRSSIIGNSQTVPIKEGKLLLGQWQKIMIANFDDKDRERDVVVTITGD
jgi:secondary thiamine-phosphate synthase enzyme